MESNMLIKGHYKTYDGAARRAGFENGLARHEFERGYKAKVYRYTVVSVDGMYRVERKPAPTSLETIGR